MILSLQRETSQLPPQVVREIAYQIKLVADQEGGKYKIRGYNGKKVSLGAEVQRSRQFLGSSSTGRRQLGRATGSQMVRAYPVGFWSIVERGSGRHLITGRTRKNGRRLTAKGAMSGFLKASASGNKFAVANPIRLKPGSKGSGGWAQWADHPGHRPLGAPWKRTVARARVLHRQMVDDRIRGRLIQAFFR